MRVLLEILVWCLGIGVVFTLTRGFPGLARVIFSPIGGLVAVALFVFLFVIPRLRGPGPKPKRPR